MLPCFLVEYALTPRAARLTSALCPQTHTREEQFGGKIAVNGTHTLNATEHPGTQQYYTIRCGPLALPERSTSPMSSIFHHIHSETARSIDIRPNLQFDNRARSERHSAISRYVAADCFGALPYAEHQEHIACTHKTDDLKQYKYVITQRHATPVPPLTRAKHKQTHNVFAVRTFISDDSHLGTDHHLCLHSVWLPKRSFLWGQTLPFFS